jgi:hypothetical protein
MAVPRLEGPTLIGAMTATTFGSFHANMR